jgi:acetolactate synthase-1/2/3 large subunit
MPITKHSFLVKRCRGDPGAIAAASRSPRRADPVPCSSTSRRTRSRPKAPFVWPPRRPARLPPGHEGARQADPGRGAADRAREEARAVRRWRRHARGVRRAATLAERPARPSSRR